MKRSRRIREQYGWLWDGRHFNPDYDKLIAHVSSTSCLALYFADLNGLGELNRAHGHLKVSGVVALYFRAIAKALPNKGSAYPIGGDEVAVLLPNANKKEVLEVGRRMCREIKAVRSAILAKSHRRLTVAIGCAFICDARIPLTVAFSSAEQAMGRAKRKAKRRSPYRNAIHLAGARVPVLID